MNTSVFATLDCLMDGLFADTIQIGNRLIGHAASAAFDICFNFCQINHLNNLMSCNRADGHSAIFEILNSIVGV